jgi:signal transduction histidine kinase
MLHEREQLARELHDSTGQVLGYAGFQLEVVHDRIMDGQAALSAGQVADVHTHLAEAGNQLTRLSSIVAEAHADVREYILDLQVAPSDQRPFFATLQHYLDGFSLNYSIQTELLVGPGVDEGKFDPEAQMQLFRVIQEALSNARKHAGASCLQVSFEKQDHLVRIRIQDNGRGFDPARAMSDGGSHFGLRFMRERAEQIGGNLRVQSATGEGTCVTLDVPVEGKT